MDTDVLRARVSDIVAGFPEARATPTMGVHLRLEVRGKRFGWFMEDHHGDGRIVIELKALPGVASGRASTEGVYYIPSYGGSRGWIGIALDRGPVDWDEAESLLREAYAMTAPASLRGKLDGMPARDP